MSSPSWFTLWSTGNRLGGIRNSEFLVPLFDNRGSRISNIEQGMLNFEVQRKLGATRRLAGRAPFRPRRTPCSDQPASPDFRGRLPWRPHDLATIGRRPADLPPPRNRALVRVIGSRR